MRDEKVENQEYFASQEVNDFHSSAKAKELSADSSSGTDTNEKTLEKTLTNTSSHIGVSVMAGATSTAAVALTSVLVLSSNASTLPKISSLAIEATSISVSYSFSCSYSGSGSLLVRLSSAFDEKSNVIVLSDPSSSSSSLSSVSSSASSTNERQFAGVFNSLTSGTDYVLTIQTPFTGNTYTTLSQRSVTTSTSKGIALSFAQVSVDYALSQVLYSLQSDDPSSLPAMNELYLHLKGKDVSGAAHEEEKALTGTYQERQSASLEGFMKGYYLRLCLLGANEDNSAGDPAKIYAEMALYY